MEEKSVMIDAEKIEELKQRSKEPSRGLTLFVPEDYTVSSYSVKLGQITVPGTEWRGDPPQLGEKFDALLRDVHVERAITGEDGEVTLVLACDNVRRN